MNIWLDFFIDSLAFGATFIYGSTGEILTEKAGHLNLGIPGIMCMGGAGGCLVLNQGAAQISQDFNVSSAFPNVIVGIILFFIIGSEFFINYQIHFRRSAGKEE